MIEAIGYDPEADVENTPDSVFCAHGAGYIVKWNEVPDHMHVESGFASDEPEEEEILEPVIVRLCQRIIQFVWFMERRQGNRAIFNRTFGSKGGRRHIVVS
ncbi:MAG: hypothetical protein V8S26_06510 [Lachnospiraceae bacterium]